MMQPLFLRLALGFATLACLACLPAAASAVEINDSLRVQGHRHRHRSPAGARTDRRHRVPHRGKFDYDGPLDLTTSTVTFHHFLDEHLTGGNGEMVLTTDNADLVCPEPNPAGADCVATLAPLLSSSSSKTIEAKYETPGRFRPPMRVQIKNKAGEYQFNVRLDRGTSPQVLPAQRGPLRRAPPSRGSAVPEALRRRSIGQEQARKDGPPHQLHDRRWRERAGRARLREGLGVQSARPLPPPVALSDLLE